MWSVTMDTDSVQRRLCIVVVVTLFCTLVCIEVAVPVKVIRRPCGDIVRFSNSSRDVICKADMKLTTYLVDEKRCVNNQDLYNGSYIITTSMSICVHTNTIQIHADCSFAVAPSEWIKESSILRIAVDIGHGNNKTLMVTDESNSESLSDAVIIERVEPYQRVNSSLCHISSLEVYQGRQQTTEMNPNAFYISESGSTKVNCNACDVVFIHP